MGLRLRLGPPATSILAVIALATFALAGGLAVPTPTATAQEQRPNILVILTDDQRASISSMPQTTEWLREGGTRFPRAFATTPLCCPSRASIFTGRYAHNHRVQTNPEASKLDQETTIQRYLQDAGYRTAIVGKFLNEWDLSKNPPYFDRWAIMTQGYYDAPFNIDGSQQVVSQYSTDFIADHASEVMEGFEGARDEVPWFLYVAPYAPHSPYLPAPEYEDAPVGKWDGNPGVRERNKNDKPPYVQNADATLTNGRIARRGQLRLLLSVDDLVGDMFQTLQATGELDRTLVFFLSDNGFMWAEHGLMGKPYPYRQSADIPLLMWWPGHVAEGAADDRLVANIDIAPTILEAAGESGVSPPMDGWSLLGGHVRERILVEAWTPVRVGRWASMRTGTFTYTEYYGTDGTGVEFREFYRHTDTWELVNLFRDGNPSNDPNKRRLHLRLRSAKNCLGTEGSTSCP
jgi:arylsulfatase A-like enzyme